MSHGLADQATPGAVPIVPVTRATYPEWFASRPERERRWLEATGFEPAADRHCLVPRDDHTLGAVVLGAGEDPDPWALAALPGVLPRGCYRVDAPWAPERLALAALGWGLGVYRYARYRDAEPPDVHLALEGRCSLDAVRHRVEAVALVRDLINTPAQDLGPTELGDAIEALASDFDARVERIRGDDLLEQRLPAIHAVGRASASPPELVDMTWGQIDHPRVTLVGKGVCFDSGGLDLKSASNMRLMKKDMGGAAHAAGLARLVMAEALPVRLRLLVPAVENAVAGNAFRPGDVLRTRAGTTVEVDNTDAEGRIVLCDALTLAGEEEPDLMVDFATLTGAARVALGTELPALFSNDDAVARGILTGAEQARDPLWRLPLHSPYREMLESRVADLVNSASTPFAGAITAALFLEHFVPQTTPWAHFDLMAWNLKSRPGRPEGGEAMGLRAVFDYLSQRYG